MFPVRFYKSFSKRKNSTKRPANTDAYDEINVELKENTTVETPSLVLTQTAASASGNPVTINALGGEMINPVVTFNPVQLGSGTPSPSDPHPISGYNSLDITVNGNTTSINLGETVYGGICNIANGEIIKKYTKIDATTIIANYSAFNASKHLYYVTFTGLLNAITLNTATVKNPCNMACNILPFDFNWNEIQNFDGLTPCCGMYHNTAWNYTRLYLILPTTVTTRAEAETWLLNSGIEITYELENTTTLTITATTISLDHGTNTVTVNGSSTIAFNYVKGQIELDYVYAYIPKFDKYYFVSSPTILSDYHVQYDIVEDYLASRKTEVGSTVAHIVYSSTGWDKDLTDARIGVKGTKTIYHDSQALPFTSAGCYIVGVVNDQTDGKRGALSYYRMDATNLAKLIKWMMNDDFWNKIRNYFTGKPMDFIQSCIWCPVNGSDFGNTLQTTMYLGSTAVADYSTVPETAVLISHYPISTTVKAYPVVSVSLGSKFNDFRDAQPYTSASLYLPGVGLTDLNANDFYESTNVNIETIFDITTGDCTYKIYDDTNQLLKTVSFNASASVSLSQVNINSAGAIAGIGGAVGGVVGLGVAAVTMNPLAGVTAGVGILGGASAAIMAANQRSTSIKGTNSGRSGFYTNMASTVVIRQDTEDCDDASYIARIGRPVGKTHAISNHSGYVQCEAASVAIAGDNTEREIINNYLNTGFFYE